MPVLTDFRSVEAVKPIPQMLSLEVSCWAFANAYCARERIVDPEAIREVRREVRARFSRYAVSPKLIRRRQLVFFPRLGDVRWTDAGLALSEPEEAHLRLLPDWQEPRGVDLKSRHASYGRVVEGVLRQLYEASEAGPDDWIHVTCSGYLAPSPVERLAAKNGWFETTVTHCYHKGCYGAFPAVKMGHGFLASSRGGFGPVSARVEIVHTELLSLHRDVEDWSPQNIITLTLFGDGFIRYTLLSDEEAARRSVRGLKLLGYREHLLPDSAEEMSWIPGSHHFDMTLTTNVPTVIRESVRPFATELLRSCGMDWERDGERLLFALHPGGPRIVDSVQEEMGLHADQVAFSRRIFRENGNMSSATVPHIWKEILAEPAV
ncbi:partial alkylresorcinol/alkylpyrone synthase, partial [Methylacidimicrobium cyclopophantes]